MVHARLGIAQDNSGKLVRLVRRETRRMAEEKGLEPIITDGPPGIQAATMVADKGAEVLLAGYCGPNAFKTVQAAGMKVVKM